MNTVSLRVRFEGTSSRLQLRALLQVLSAPSLFGSAKCSKFYKLRSLSHKFPTSLHYTMAKDCLARVTTGVAVGGAVGGAIGAVYGTYEAFRFRVPGLLKVRYIGQTTVGSAAVFGLFLGAGSLIHCGKSF